MPSAGNARWRAALVAVNKSAANSMGSDKIAAGVVFKAPDGRVLLLKRSDKEKNFAGHWSLPGGGADPGETPEQAATRECREEIGREPEGELKPIARRVTPTGMTFHTFEVKAPSKFAPKLNFEHTAHVWAKPDQLPEPMHPAVKDVLLNRR